MYKVLIIGAGQQGSGADHPNSDKIITYAHAFKERGANLSFFELDLEKSLAAADKWGCNSEGIFEASYLDYKKFDIAVIATPDYAHHHILKQLAETSLKLVICEKPLCTDLDQARKIVELYKQKNIPLMVNYTRRFIPYYNYLKRHGKPKFGLCVFNRGWLHTASHAIDFFNMIGCEDYELHESSYKERRWILGAWYDDHVFIESRISQEPVWWYYDKSHRHVVDNAYSFLAGKEPLKCTSDDALKALEKCYELMGQTL